MYLGCMGFTGIYRVWGTELGLRDMTPIMENVMEKKMDNEMAWAGLGLLSVALRVFRG